MNFYSRTRCLFTALIVVVTSNVGCAVNTPEAANIPRCGNSPIANSVQAEQRAQCEFQVISEACLSSQPFRREVTRVADNWEVRSYPPLPTCSAWLAILRASDGSLVSLTTLP